MTPGDLISYLVWIAGGYGLIHLYREQRARDRADAHALATFARQRRALAPRQCVHHDRAHRAIELRPFDWVEHEEAH